MTPIYSTVLVISLVGSAIAATGASIDFARPADIGRRVEGAFLVASAASSTARATPAARPTSGRGDRLRAAGGGAGTITIERRTGPGTSVLVRIADTATRSF